MSRENEEKLREAACIGDLEQLKILIESGQVNVNSQNAINGWTPLHWACKRGHITAVQYLLDHGADKTLGSNSQEIPAQLTSVPEIHTLLQYSGIVKESTPLAITPNYIKHPVFPYATEPQSGTQHDLGPQSGSQLGSSPQQQPAASGQSSACIDQNELVLKSRVAYSDEKDFIEVELSRDRLTFENLKTVLTNELGVDRALVNKIRKLPNTIVRKDKDVERLLNYQELEVVLNNKIVNTSSRGYGDISDGMKNEQILY